MLGAAYVHYNGFSLYLVSDTSIKLRRGSLLAHVIGQLSVLNIHINFTTAEPLLQLYYHETYKLIL